MRPPTESRGRPEHLEDPRDLGVVAPVPAARYRSRSGDVEKAVPQEPGVDMNPHNLAEDQRVRRRPIVQVFQRQHEHQLALQRGRGVGHARRLD
jgi:hypothetical protein